jgi:hypothetical protein
MCSGHFEGLGEYSTGGRDAVAPTIKLLPSNKSEGIENRRVARLRGTRQSASFRPTGRGRMNKGNHRTLALVTTDTYDSEGRQLYQ